MSSTDQKSGKKTILKKNVTGTEVVLAIDFLSKETPLSKSKIKDLMNRGAVWHTPKNKKSVRKRLRRAQKEVFPGDLLELYYDPTIEPFSVADIAAIHLEKDFALYYKPAGVLSQGTNYGDEGSILRELEKKHKEVFLIHRLDRETAGIMIFAFTAKMATHFSELFKKGAVKKFYQAIVLGTPTPKEGEITLPIDGEKAITRYKVLNEMDGMSHVEIELITGKTHQIRKHFAAISNPVMGDPLYGSRNKNRDGLKLVAYKVLFPHPHRKNEISEFLIDEGKRLF